MTFDRPRGPALWAIRAGKVPAPKDAPMWVRLGKAEALEMLSKMHDQLVEPLTRPKP